MNKDQCHTATLFAFIFIFLPSAFASNSGWLGLLCFVGWPLIHLIITHSEPWTPEDIYAAERKAAGL